MQAANLKVQELFSKSAIILLLILICGASSAGVLEKHDGRNNWETQARHFQEVQFVATSLPPVLVAVNHRDLISGETVAHTRRRNGVLFRNRRQADSYEEGGDSEDLLNNYY